MKTIKFLIIAFTAFVVIGAFYSTMHTKLEPPKTEAQKRDDAVNAALYGCENWTHTHSRVAVGEIVDRYQMSGTLPAHHVKVGIEYRGGGNGIMMRSTCEYQEANGTMLLVVAKSGVK